MMMVRVYSFSNPSGSEPLDMTNPRMPQPETKPDGRPGRLWYAGGTALAAAAAAGVGHLVAGLVSPEASPVLAVGSTVIDATPTPVKEWAVAQFGTADKPILIGSVAIGALLLAGGIGLIARTRRTLGPGPARRLGLHVRRRRPAAPHEHRGGPAARVRHGAVRRARRRLVPRAPRPVGGA